jgi:hypothetical protein
MVLIKVRVIPNSKKEELIKKAKNQFEVRVKEKPIFGLANKRVKQILSTYFNLSQSEVRLVKGFRQRNKVFEINIYNVQKEKSNF